MKAAYHSEADRVKLLIIFSTAAWAFLTGLAYIVPGGQSIEQLTWIKAVMSAPFWGVLWIISALMVLSGLKFPRMLRYGLSMVAGLTIIWALSFGLSWADGSNRAWVSAKNYAYLAALVASSSVLLSLRRKCGEPRSWT